ncbi:hypothetical protein MJH54_28080, partial [Salmonella enterica subsp. enterica serovar Montevideo]|nr:hypothetical protein [Salmonella enterica subsp. enterica serovar Montevideo]
MMISLVFIGHIHTVEQTGNGGLAGTCAWTVCVPERIKKELIMVSLEKNDRVMLARQLPLK